MSRPLPESTVPYGEWIRSFHGYKLFIAGERYGEVRNNWWTGRDPLAWTGLVFAWETQTVTPDRPCTRREAMACVEQEWHRQRAEAVKGGGR